MIHVNTGNAEQYDASVLLQRGVFVERPDASSVMDFICKLLDLEPEEVSRQVKTIFMDNQVVDDPSVDRIENGTTLVLSGAMPGLVGAMLRSDSPYKAMRATITSAGSGKAETPLIQIKLFNTVLMNHTKAMVKNGFWIDDD